MRKLDKTIDGDRSKPMKSFLKYGCLVLVALVAVLLPVLIATTVYANPGLTVSSALVLTVVSPGQTLTHTMTVSIGSNDPATNISVQVYGVQQSLQGAYIPLNASQDTGPYSARTFTTVDNSSFHLEPGGSQDMTATIQIPQDVGDGGRYAVITIQTQPVPGVGINIITEVIVPVYLTIQGSQLIHQGEITAFTVGEATSGQPVNISTTFQNTGNHNFKIKGEVTVKNDQGQSLGNISIPVTVSSLLPGALKQLKAAFIPNGELAQGTYTVSSQVMLEDGTILDEASTTFTVETAYVPPPSVGNIMLTPSSASTLTSENGISIYFPQGAVLSPVNISLQDYTVEQLPALPYGDIATGICFRVDGLSGLLVKEATVIVKYTADDLAAAGGDVSKLRLARWDNGQWTVLETNADEGAMTLSASSNQMSIWAVVVVPHESSAAESSGASWVTPVAAIVGAIVLALVVVVMIFLVRRRR